MVTENSPLASFPSAATCDALNAKVAKKSVNGYKRKRERGSTYLPDELLNMLCYDQVTGKFRPETMKEISAVLNIAAQHDLTISVLNIKGTGTHGNATGGDIVIDLCAALFQGIEIDKTAMTVKIGGGVTSRMVDVELSAQGLSTPVVGYTVGLGAFLSGGFGFSSRLHGLTVDNILEMEIILPDGRLVVVNEVNEPDLFWALRGCGTSFGIVTSILLRCYPLRKSWSANIIYPFQVETGANLLRHWRDCLEDAPNELYSNFVLAAGPDAPKNPVAIIQLCHLGTDEVARQYVDRVASFPGVKNQLKDYREITYLRQQELVEAVLKGAAIDGEARAESKTKYLLDGDVMTDLTEEIIEESCHRFHEEAPPGSIWCFELFGGALKDVSNGCIPDVLRQGKYHAATILRVPAENPETWQNDIAGRDWVRETLRKASPGGPLPSFLLTSTSDPRLAKRYHDVIRGSYGHANWSNLKKIKKKYDPNNLFCHGFDVGMLGHEEDLVDGL